MRLFLLAAASVFALSACGTMQQDAGVHVPMALATASGPGASIGEIVLHREGAGVALALDLHGLPPGPHGFHLHAMASCDAAANAAGAMAPAGAAGGHFDPANTGHHMGPMGEGHLGDLPLIEVGADGTAHQTLHVTRLHSPDEFKGHALMIHAGGDNYSDSPAPLGGGGARIACGVVS